MKACCPTCKRALPAIKAAAPLTHTDTSKMTDAQVRAYYAAIAPVEDVKAFLRNGCLTSALEREALALLERIENQGGKHTPATKHAYKVLHQHWRAESDRRENTYTAGASYSAA